MGRRRGRTTGTFLIGAFVLIAFAYALFGHPAEQRTIPSPVVKAEMSHAERSLSVGASVVATDGSKVGSVSGISRNVDGHIERIRVITAAQLGFGERTVIIRHTAFTIEESRVRLRLSAAEVNSLPGAMESDDAAG